MIVKTVPLSPPYILVVDDDSTIRLLAAEVLEQSGYIVTEAENGEAALACFAAQPPQLILLDVIMPKIDGFEVCRQIRSREAGLHTPILIMTGQDDTGSIEQAFEAGATDFITKPINWLLLAHRVNYMLRANQAFHDLRNSELQLQTAQRIAKLGSWSLDLMNNTVNGSLELSTILGLAPSSFYSTYDKFLSFIHPLDKEQVKLTIDGAVSAKQPFQIDHKIILASGMECFVSTEGKPVLDQNGQPFLMTGTMQDITERKQAEAKIRALALYDSLTGLPNRVLFRDRLEQAIRQAKRLSGILSVMFIDLDNFKDVNDSLGHDAGDALLSEVAQRLLAVTRAADTVSRLGGDEFTIFLQNLPSFEGVCNVADKILESLSQSFEIESHTIFITASIGIAVYPHDGDTVEALLKQADTAMYIAKEQGKNNYQLFSPVMQKQMDLRLVLKKGIRDGLQNGQFILHYQPRHNLQTGEITGMEALVRWQHPEKGLIHPDYFIPQAEETGLITLLGEWVLLEACRQNMKWQHMGYQPVMITVNVSCVQLLNQSKFLGVLRKTLANTGMEPRLLQLDITESAMLKHQGAEKKQRNKQTEPAASSPHDRKLPINEAIFATLEEIQQMGVSIALDDFGAGYHSWSYLRHIPFNALKINPSFIRDINASQGNEILAAIIKMSKSLKMIVVAEAVETEDQRAYLLQQGCDEVQGYLNAKPAAPEEAVQYLLPRSNK